MKHIGNVIEGMELKPIKTEYAGHLFRSRLEARWAHFFDLLELRWTYEPEGFELPDGRYLPDFEVILSSGERCYFEVKPDEPSFEERRKAEQLACGSGRRVFITWGPPDNDVEGEGIECFWLTPGGVSVQDLGYRFCPCPRCGRIGIAFEGRGARVCGDRCIPDSDRCHSGDALAEAARLAKARRYWG
jgi:hypothetical protein